MADENQLNQDEIERLLSQASPKPAPAPPKAEPPAEQSAAMALDQNEIEALMGGGGAPAASKSPQPAETGSSPPAPASADDDKLLAQDDIEKLLSQAGRATPQAQAAGPKQAAQESHPAGDDMAEGDIAYLLTQAQEALESIDAPADDPQPQGVAAFRLEEFPGAPASSEAATLDLIRDVELDLRIELGRTHMYLEDVLRLKRGSVVPLDKLAGDPVDIFVNGRLVARGEVLVLNDNFCVRVAELLAGVGPGP